MDPGQQTALVELGQAALTGIDLPTLTRQAAALVASKFEPGCSAVWELQPDRAALLLRAGAGWQDDAVGHATIGAEAGSPAGQALLSGTPAIVVDWRSETRFSQPALLRDHRVISSLYVIIHGGNHPFGVFSVDSPVRRTFANDEIQFVQTVANVLALAIERARVDESLHTSKERFRRLTENATDIIYDYRLTPTPHFDYISPAATAITGYTPAEFYADPSLVSRLVHPADRPLLEARLQSTAPHGEPLTVRLFHKDGALVWTEQRVVPILDAAGNLVAVEGIVRDISKRKRLEIELAEAHRRLADSRETARLFLARELHDNAVQQLLGISYQIAEHTRGGNAQHLASQANEALLANLAAVRQAILRVVRQIRGLIGELRPAGLEEFGLTTALKGYVTHLSRGATPGQATISLDLVETGTGLPRLLALCLFRVAQEALRNALRHAAARHIHLSLSCSGETIVLRIADDGRGFHVPEQLSELAHNDHFGLVGMAEWVAWVNGQLAIESQPGDGTEVVVRVPLPMPAHSARRGGSVAAGGWPESHMQDHDTP